MALLEAGNTATTCAVCGSRVSWRHKVDETTGRWEPTGEVVVL
jgi:hypothetical protein